MNLNIDTIIEGLKDGKTKRTQASLEKLNQTLKDYYESGQRDFSITTIGRISTENGGVGYQAIRATRNEHFRKLIGAWAAKANTTTKKPLSKNSRSRYVPTDNKLLERIADPALRALFGQIIAERNRYRNDVKRLKQYSNVVIDRRPVRHFDAQVEPKVELLSSLSGLLTPKEIEALQFAVSDECMEKHNWQTTQAGQVKEMDYNTEIFPRGFITGLRKLLQEVGNSKQ
jgi:hypothetical protein